MDGLAEKENTLGTPELEVLEHAAPTYSPRTYANARVADLTVAFAVDFGTAGERLTHKAAGERYVGIPLDVEPLAAARMLYSAMKMRRAASLNIAGNGIYTLARHDWSQEKINQYVYDVLSKVHEHWTIQTVRSGGQTGVDLAGVTAAYALCIPATALLPKGFIQRAADKIDRSMSAEAVRAQIEIGARKLIDGA